MKKKIMTTVATVAFAVLAATSNIHSFVPQNDVKLLSSRTVESNQNLNKNKIIKDVADKAYFSDELKADKIVPEIKNKMEEIFEQSQIKNVERTKHFEPRVEKN
ncbi:MAG: hypothetical protein ACRDD2_07735 [Sarcina sp.]